MDFHSTGQWFGAAGIILLAVAGMACAACALGWAVDRMRRRR